MNWFWSRVKDLRLSLFFGTCAGPFLATGTSAGEQSLPAHLYNLLHTRFGAMDGHLLVNY
jgi:hypothetical protein